MQELLGYTSVAITPDTYSHILPGMDGEAADSMSEALGLLCPAYVSPEPLRIGAPRPSKKQIRNKLI